MQLYADGYMDDRLGWRQYGLKTRTIGSFEEIKYECQLTPGLIQFGERLMDEAKHHHRYRTAPPKVLSDKSKIMLQKQKNALRRAAYKELTLAGKMKTLAYLKSCADSKDSDDDDGGFFLTQPKGEEEEKKEEDIVPTRKPCHFPDSPVLVFMPTGILMHQLIF